MDTRTSELIMLKETSDVVNFSCNDDSPVVDYDDLPVVDYGNEASDDVESVHVDCAKN